MVKGILDKILNNKHLSEEEAKDLMDNIMDARFTQSQISAILVGLRMKRETPEELTGFVKSIREHAKKIKTRHSIVVDTCGTGGDGLKTFNISTASAFVVAGAGIPVAKHGNRSVSSSSGSADVLERLGFNINLNAQAIEDCLNHIGIAFLFAPLLHPSMKNVALTRRELGIRTFFNILGPLTNPAGVDNQVIGVFDKSIMPTLAEVIKNLNPKHIYLVHGAGGMDELSLEGPNYVIEIRGNKSREFFLDPEQYNFQKVSSSEFVVKNSEESAKRIIKILRGEKSFDKDIVVLNAAIAIMASDYTSDFKEAIMMAKDSIDSKLALSKFETLKTYTNTL
ncbi:MAG TPA: anthranilate phosphoribosyltransferase [Thermodesulfobium narugense]|nr:MAG: anthranilate phosphoribosyltransferase [Thermodesulfobium narugense]HEM56187.1 anthranilate phosphoribosyltransferase [Thermodesulfobium narugense]